MRSIARWAACMAVVSALAGPALADEIVLANGGLIRGTIVEEGKKEVVIRLDDGNKLALSRKQIKEVRRSEGSGGGSSSRPAGGDGGLGTPARLRWKLKPGEELKMRTKSQWRFGAVGGPEAKRVRSTSELTLKVLSVGESDMRVELTIDRTKETKGKGDKEQTLDTKSKDPAQRPKAWEMIDKPMEVRLSERGDVLEVLRFHGMLLTDMPEQDQRNVERMVGENLMRISVLCMLGTLPEGLAEPGKSTWKDAATASGPGMGDLTFRVLNRLQRIVGGTATIEQRGNVETTGIKRNQLRNTKIRGELRFSVERGRLLSARQVTSVRHAPQHREARGCDLGRNAHRVRAALWQMSSSYARALGQTCRRCTAPSVGPSSWRALRGTLAYELELREARMPRISRRGTGVQRCSMPSTRRSISG